VISEAQKRGVKLEVAVHLRGEVPVWEQGNMDLYTPEILVLRHDLRHDRGIVHEIEKYWHIAGMAKTADGEYLHKVGYCRMLRCFYAALLGERDEAHAQQLADEDWERDTNGAKMLSHEQFQRSLFELADLWCEGVEPAEYVEFLRRLHGSVTCELGDASHGQFHDLKEDGSDAHHARNTKGLQEVHSFAALEGEGRAQEMRGGEMVHCGEGGGGDGGNPRGEPGGGGNTRRGSVDWVAPEWDDAAEQHCRFLNTDEIEPIPFPEDEAEDDSSSGEDGGGSGGSGGGGGGEPDEERRRRLAEEEAERARRRRRRQDEEDEEAMRRTEARTATALSGAGGSERGKGGKKGEGPGRKVVRVPGCGEVEITEVDINGAIMRYDPQLDEVILRMEAHMLSHKMRIQDFFRQVGDAGL
jgi:hypothetical protein